MEAEAEKKADDDELEELERREEDQAEWERGDDRKHFSLLIFH